MRKICKSDKIVAKEILHKYVVNWYLTYLLYTGMDFTEATSSQHYYWPSSREKIRTHIKVCKKCQKNRKKKKYGHLLTKELEAITWDILLVDLIGKYKVRRECHDKPS